MRDKVLDYYKTLLAVGWLVPDEEGNISLKAGDMEMAATIDGKRLVLPTREQMKSNQFDQRVRFHPLNEHLNLGVSDVLATFRTQVSNRLSTSLQYFMKQLIELAADQDLHKSLSSEQGQVLNVLSKVDEKNKDRIRKSFDELTKKIQLTNGEISFVNIYIKRGGTIGKQAFSRVGVATFPLYKELTEGKKVIAGCKLAGDDRDQLRGLYEFIFPTLTVDPEWYNVGVNTRTAPNLECFVRVTIRLISDLMDAARPYMDILPGLRTALDFPDNLADWLALFDDKDALEKAARSIPSQKGNEGRGLNEKPASAPAQRTASEAVRDIPTRTEERRETASQVQTTTEEAKPKRGIMRIGNPTPEPTTTTSGLRPQANAAPPQSGLNHSEIERLRREQERRRLEEEEDRDRDRGRRSRDRDDDDRDRRDRDRDRDDRDDRDDRRGRDRDRDRRDDRDDRRRDRDDDRDRDRRRGAWDNPVLARNLDDARDDERYGRRDRDDRDYDRGRGRDRYDDRDRDYDRGSRYGRRR